MASPTPGTSWSLPCLYTVLDVLPHLFDGVGGVPIGPGLERLAPFQFQDVSYLVEDRCDLFIEHLIVIMIPDLTR